MSLVTNNDVSCSEVNSLHAHLEKYVAGYFSLRCGNALTRLIVCV